MQELKQWLELAYFISGIVLACVAIYGLQQIKIMKRDMATRAERAAKEKAIEYSSRYLSAFCEISRAFFNEYRENKMEPYKGQIGDFTLSSFPKEHFANAKKRFSLSSWLPAMNELEAIASAFTTGVADERTGFNIIGRTYCLTVIHDYDIIALCRNGNACDYYQSIVDLYKIWSPRLNKAELEAARQKMDERISCIPDACIPPIGS